MATTTPNLGLTKPEVADRVNVSDINENADLLDAIIGKLSDLNTAQKDSLVAAINEAAQGGGSGVALDATEKSLLLTLFKNAAYTADMSATIAQLETLWSGTEEPDEPVVPDIPEADVSQTGSVLSIVSGVTATQNGAVLAIA